MGTSFRCTALALTSVVLLAGCGSDAPESAPDEPAASTATPSASPTPTVEPASGVRLAYAGAAMRAPAGWERLKGPIVAPWSKSASDPDLRQSFIRLSALTTLNLRDPVAKRGQLAARLSHHDYPDSTVEVLDMVELDGVEFYHIAGKENGYWLDQYGTVLGDFDRDLQLEFWLHPSEYPSRQEREELIAPILASVEIDDDALP